MKNTFLLPFEVYTFIDIYAESVWSYCYAELVMFLIEKTVF